MSRVGYPLSVTMENNTPQPNKRTPRATRLVSLFLLPYGALCLAMFAFQKRLLFLPSVELEADPSSVQLDHEDVWIETGQERVHGWYLPHPTPRANVLFLHGNAGNISHRLGTLGILHGLGLSVLIIDYPGYGSSTGAPDEQSCERAARAALAELERRTAHDAPIVVWGRSLGGGVASALASDDRVRLLVLESTFTSLPELAQDLYPWLPARWLTRMQFPSVDRVREADLPVLVIHSRDDTLIPFEHGQALHAAAGTRGTFIPIHGGHNDGFLSSGSRYRAPIDAFLGTHLID